MTTESPLSARVTALLAEGRGEEASGVAFLPLLELDAGARLAIGAGLRWLVVPGDGGAVAAFGPGREQVLIETIERRRPTFEADLADAARSLGLDGDALVDAYPFVEIARSVLESRSAYLLRLALEWLRPTELRDLRESIARVAAQSDLPVPVRELARRLVMP